jgi:histidine phosphotransferase ChpT
VFFNSEAAMTDASALRIAGLLASRLCHDLVGPLGAVNNGLELIAEDDDMAEEALSLAQRSAKRASSRLQFFRFAFGAAGGEPSFGHGEARPIALGLLSNGDVAVDWPEAKGIELPAGAGRLLLNLALLASECLPRGGNVRMSLAANRVAIEASGPQARLSAETKAAVAGSVAPAQLTARTVVGYYVMQLANGLGGRLEMIDDGGAVRFQIVFAQPT